jgi:hypothetical protein
MSESQTINIDGKDYEYEDLSDVAKDAVRQLSTIQTKQANVQSEYNLLEMARTGYIATLNTEISEEA